MSFISDFSANLQADPQFRKKTIFAVIASIGLIGLISLMIWVNFGQSNTKSTQTTTPKDDTPLSTPPATVNTTTFKDSTGLTQADNELVRYGSSVTITKDNKIGFITDKGLVRYDQKTITTPFQYGPSKLYPTVDGVIINEPVAVSLLKKDGTISGFPAGVAQVLPVAVTTETVPTNLYYFLKSSEGKTTINQATKIDLSDAKQLFEVIFAKDKVYFYHELRQIGSEVYLVSYQNLDKTGIVDIYGLKTGKLETALELKKVESVAFGASQILVTDELEKATDLTNYRNVLYDFTTTKPIPKPFDISTKLGTDGIYGNVFADRCAFDSQGVVYCLVKKQKTQVSESGAQDALVKHTIKSSKTEYLLNGNIFSGSDLIVSSTNEVYMVGQENRILYKVEK
jgi:hypothetical protein